MLSDSTIEHMCKTRLEGLKAQGSTMGFSGEPGVCGFLGFKIRHLKDAIRVDMLLDIDNLEISFASSFELKPNCSKAEVLNELDEIAEAIKTARAERRWLPLRPEPLSRTLPGTGLRGRWSHAAGEKPHG